MDRHHLFRHVPRRVLNAAVIIGGITGIVLQAQLGWSVITTFLVTLALCALAVAAVALLWRGRRS